MVAVTAGLGRRAAAAHPVLGAMADPAGDRGRRWSRSPAWRRPRRLRAGGWLRRPPLLPWSPAWPLRSPTRRRRSRPRTAARCRRLGRRRAAGLGGLGGRGRPPGGGGSAAGGGGQLAAGGGGSAAGGSGSAAGGGGSQVSSALTKALKADASKYRWVAAISGSQSAASLELATGGDPVMAIGGFSGLGGNLSLAQFEKYVKAGEIHYYIAGGGGGGFGGGGAAGGFRRCRRLGRRRWVRAGGRWVRACWRVRWCRWVRWCERVRDRPAVRRSDRVQPRAPLIGVPATSGGFPGGCRARRISGGSRRRGPIPAARGAAGGGRGSRRPGGGQSTASITTWVEAHYKAVTIGGQTVYDLTQPKS